MVTVLALLHCWSTVANIVSCGSIQFSRSVPLIDFIGSIMTEAV
jgi:hypothetical protein